MNRTIIPTPPRLSQTAIAEPLQTDDHRSLYPVNVCRGGVSCTLNTRYDGLSETTDIITLEYTTVVYGTTIPIGGTLQFHKNSQ